MNMLSLFSGCGGMDIGFEGNFTCLKKSINTEIHPNWITEDNGEWVTVAPTIFETVFANDIRPDEESVREFFIRRVIHFYGMIKSGTPAPPILILDDKERARILEIAQERQKRSKGSLKL